MYLGVKGQGQIYLKSVIHVQCMACHKDILFDIFSHKPEGTFTVNPEIL